MDVHRAVSRSEALQDFISYKVFGKAMFPLLVLDLVEAKRLIFALSK